MPEEVIPESTGSVMSLKVVTDPRRRRVHRIWKHNDLKPHLIGPSVIGQDTRGRELP